MAQVESCDEDRLGGFGEMWRALAAPVSCCTDATQVVERLWGVVLNMFTFFFFFFQRTLYVSIRQKKPAIKRPLLEGNYNSPHLMHAKSTKGLVVSFWEGLLFKIAYQFRTPTEFHMS